MLKISLAVGLAALAGCAGVQQVPDSYASTGAPFKAALSPFASVELPANSMLVGAKVDGRDAWCNNKLQASYHALGGQRNGVCWFDTKNDGYLDSYYVLASITTRTFRIR